MKRNSLIGLTALVAAVSVADSTQAVICDGVRGSPSDSFRYSEPPVVSGSYDSMGDAYLPAALGGLVVGTLLGYGLGSIRSRRE